MDVGVTERRGDESDGRKMRAMRYLVCSSSLTRSLLIVTFIQGPELDKRVGHLGFFNGCLTFKNIYVKIYCL